MAAVRRQMNANLTDEQEEELNKVVLSYLKEGDYKSSFEAFKEETQLKPYSKRNMLAHKWRSIMKLQKQIMELETEVSQITSDYASMGTPGGKINNSERLPRAPAKFTFNGHSNVITCVKFHPSYSLIASASEDASIRIWDYTTGIEETLMTGHQDAIQYLAFNPKGTLLASVSADLTIKIWDFEVYKCVKTLMGHDHNISGVVFTTNGKRLISCSRDKTIRIWDVQSGVCNETLSGHREWVKQVCVSPKGDIFASCGADKTIKIWDLKKGETVCVATLEQHEHIIECIAFSNAPADDVLNDTLLTKEEKQAAIKEREKKAKTTLSPTSADSADGDIDSVIIKKKEKSGGSYLISGARDLKIILWDIVDVKNIKAIRVLKGHTNWIRSLCFHPGGKFLMSVSDDKCMKMWTLTGKFDKNSTTAVTPEEGELGECIRTLDKCHDSFVVSIDMPAKNPVVATGGADNTLKVWECK